MVESRASRLRDACNERLGQPTRKPQEYEEGPNSRHRDALNRLGRSLLGPLRYEEETSLRDLTDLGHFGRWQTHRILSPARLPSPSHWKQVAVVLKVCESKARTSPPWYFRIVAAWG